MAAMYARKRLSGKMGERMRLSLVNNIFFEPRYYKDVAQYVGVVIARLLVRCSQWVISR